MEPSSIAKIVSDFTPGAAGIWTLVLMAAVYFAREWRETRKLSAEDRLARRDGYAAQVDHLMAENRKLRAEVTDTRREMAANWQAHEDYRKLCHAENDQLRNHIISLEDRISGLLRKIADMAVRISRGDLDPEMARSLERLAHEASEPVTPGVPERTTR